MDKKTIVFGSVQRNAAAFVRLSDDIWEYAETGFAELRSASALAAALRQGSQCRAGFRGIVLLLPRSLYKKGQILVVPKTPGN